MRVNIIKNTQFHFEVPSDDYKEFSTPEFNVGGVLWNIKIRRIQSILKPPAGFMVGAYLVCMFNKPPNELSTWSINAGAEFKLTNSHGTSTSFKDNIQLKRFDSQNTCWELDQINILPCNISANKIGFDVMISANPLLCKPSNSTVFETSRRIFVQKIQRVFETNEIWTPVIVLRGIKFFVKFIKNEEFLGVFLELLPEHDNFGWTVAVDFKVKLCPFNDTIRPLEKSIQKRFTICRLTQGWTKFIEWNIVENKDIYTLQGDSFAEITIDVGPWQMMALNNNVDMNYNQVLQTRPLRCPVCMENLDDREVLVTSCGHLFCAPCSRQSIATNGRCSMCNVPTSASRLRSVYLN